MSLTSLDETADQLLALCHTHPGGLEEEAATEIEAATAATKATIESLDVTDGGTETETNAGTKATNLEEFPEYKTLSPVCTVKALFPIQVECPHDWFVAVIAKEHAQAEKR